MTDEDPAAALDEAVRRTVHPLARVRQGGLARLVRLADAHPRLRQPVVTVLGAYLRSSAARPEPVGTSELRVRRVVLDALRAHLLDPGAATTWCGLDVDLRDTVLDGDLSGIVVSGGAIRLDRAVVPAGGVLDLRGARVQGGPLGGGVLSADRVVVAGRLDATGLVVDGGEASFDRLVVDGGDVLLDGARLEQGCLWLRDGAVDGGTLSVRGAHVRGGRLSLSDTHVRGGEVRLDETRLDGGQLTVSGATLDGGALRLDDVRVDAGVLSLAMAAVRGGLLSLTGTVVSTTAAGGAAGTGPTVRFDGLSVEDDGVVLWGPFDPVEPPPAAEPAGAREIDLRGPAPADPWGWLRRREARAERDAANDVTTPDVPARHDVPSPQEREAS